MKAVLGTICIRETHWFVRLICLVIRHVLCVETRPGLPVFYMDKGYVFVYISRILEGHQTAILLARMMQDLGRTGKPEAEDAGAC